MDCLSEFVYTRCKPGTDAIGEGMNDVLSMYDIIRTKPWHTCHCLFMPLSHFAVPASSTVQRSCEGSNKAAAESDTLYAWEAFLLNTEGMTLQAEMTGLIVIFIL